MLGSSLDERWHSRRQVNSCCGSCVAAQHGGQTSYGTWMGERERRGGRRREGGREREREREGGGRERKRFV